MCPGDSARADGESAFPGGASRHTHCLQAEGPELGNTGARLLEPQSKLPRCSVFAGTTVYPLASSDVVVAPGRVGLLTVAAVDRRSCSALCGFPSAQPRELVTGKGESPEFTCLEPQLAGNLSGWDSN